MSRLADARIVLGATMPRYMLLLYADEVDGATQAQRDAELPVWQELTQSLREAGLLVSNSPLLGVDAATTVRVRDGVPANPGAWLTVAARRRAIDRLRRDRSQSDRGDRLGQLMRLDAQEHEAMSEQSAIVDDRLRLIFTCYHPALDM